MLISDHYRLLNVEMHEKKASYGTSGASWSRAVAELAEDVGGVTILDYGSGKGTLRPALPPQFEVFEYDPAIPGKETKPNHSDIVVCGDVLEHIEPECLNDVLDDIKNIATKAVFLVISNTEAAKHLPDGRNAHLIVEPPSWWLPKLMSRWEITLFRTLGPAFMCIGKIS